MEYFEFFDCLLTLVNFTIPIEVQINNVAVFECVVLALDLGHCLVTPEHRAALENVGVLVVEGVGLLFKFLKVVETFLRFVYPI